MNFIRHLMSIVLFSFLELQSTRKFWYCIADDSYWLSGPSSYVVFSGDLEILYRILSPARDLRLILLQKEHENKEKTLAKTDLPSNTSSGKVVFHCGTIDIASPISVLLVSTQVDKTLTRIEITTVQWPGVSVHVPLLVETYTSDVLVQLYVNTMQCGPQPRLSYLTYVDLIYEGPEISDTSWHEPTVLLSKELTGWLLETSYEVMIGCDFFDKAGYYRVRVRSDVKSSPLVSESDLIHVMWSHRYSISVAKTSVQPCDGSLSVIYRYPRCILDQDRIRVYGKSIRGQSLPLKYILESRVQTGKHSTKLPCNVFDDDYQEYCFSFVSTARNGAVFDLDTHCLPYLADSGSMLAAWNHWSPWSECSATCGTGVQSRYRFCSSPAKNDECIGKTVESQLCNSEICPDAIVETTEHPPILPSACSCGCEINITQQFLVKLALSSCESELLWIFQAWPSTRITIEVKETIFPSSHYWLTIRDGRSPLGAVLAIIGSVKQYHPVHSLTDVVRLEVNFVNSTFPREGTIKFLIERSEIKREILAMAHQIIEPESNFGLSAVHLTIIMLAAFLFTMIVLLIVMHFYRHYKIKTASKSTLSSGSQLLTSTSELSTKTPSYSPEDILHNSFIFRSNTSLQASQPKIKWDKLPLKDLSCSDTSSPVRRRGRPSVSKTAKALQRESATPLTASVSELSITASDDGFEYDYYDYGCHQEPGSFFCPDPVLVGWPPFIPLPPQGSEEFPLQHLTPSPSHSDPS